MRNTDTDIEVAHILTQFDDGGADLRDLYRSLHKRLVALRAVARDVPANAIELERQLEAEMVAESQGR